MTDASFEHLRSSRVDIREGRNIVLPGVSPSEVSEPVVFRNRLVFQVEVLDPTVGTRDGDGIRNVRMTISRS